MTKMTPEMTESMNKVLTETREMAAMLTKDADEMEKMMASMKGAAGQK
jgi:hypothetical protein